MNRENALREAIRWVKENNTSRDGIPLSSRQRVPYPEVAGYFIPTLMGAGESDLAHKLGHYLLDVQQDDGSFLSCDGAKNFFDTGQALRGLSSLATINKTFVQPAGKAADWILKEMETRRKALLQPFAWNGYINIFVMPALKEASLALGEDKYIKMAYRATENYKKIPDILEQDILTHFLAYIFQGFMEMGEIKFVLPAVNKVFSRQKGDGSISAYSNVDWICSVGLAQLAIIGYGCGLKQQADKAIWYLCNIQNGSGGFYGSYGRGAKYFDNIEISWANKFFIDAIHCALKGEK